MPESKCVYSQCPTEDGEIIIDEFHGLENKAMTAPPSAGTAQSDRPLAQAVCLNITESDRKSIAAASANSGATNTSIPVGKQRRHFRLKGVLRVPYIFNSIITIIVLSLLYLLEFGVIPGTKTGFTCNDPQLSHIYRGDTISPTVLLVGSAIGPFLVILLVETLAKRNFKNVKISDIWFYYKECLIGVNVVLVVTEIMKILVGEHRPHFFDVCQPDTNRYCQNGSFIASFTCTNRKYSHYFITDTSRSFPSGHASVSVYVALFCAYVVQSRMPTVRTGRLFKPFLVVACLTWGIVCSLTRITDRRHHWWDVLAGSCLGGFGAFYSLRLLHRKVYENEKLSRTSTSTTTLLDAKNKDATSVII